MNVGIAPIRVGPPYRTELMPACVNGHRKLMKPIATRAAYHCPECGWELSLKDWREYLAAGGMA